MKKKKLLNFIRASANFNLVFSLSELENKLKMSFIDSNTFTLLINDF